MTFPILASLLVRLVVLLPFQLLRLSLATPSRWTPLALSVFLHCVRSEERFSRNAETDLVCRLLLEKKKPFFVPYVAVTYTLINIKLWKHIVSLCQFIH